MTEVDLSQLAVDRAIASPNPLNLHRRWMTRYVLPGAMVLGFLLLVFWAAQDLVFPPRPVRVIPVWATQSQIRSEGATLFNAAGWIEPRPTPIRVAALAPGVVEELLVVEDQTVKAGDPVAELVKEDAQLAHQRSQANRQLSEAELERAKAVKEAATTRHEQPVHLQALLAEADAALAKVNTMLKNLPFETKRAESRLKFAWNDYERNVSAGSSVSEREIDEAKTEHETAEAMLEELRNRQVSLEREALAIGQRREAINVQLQLLADEIEAKDKADAEIKAAEARVQQMLVAQSEAELRLNRMTIEAPVDGRIYQLIGYPAARVGEGVMTAMAGHDGTTVVTMYQPQSLQVRVDVRFEDIPKVSLGQPVKIDNPALSQPIVGRVLFVSSEADIQKNTLQVKVAIEFVPIFLVGFPIYVIGPPDFFKPEMLVDVTFLAPKQPGQSLTADQEMRLYLPESHVWQSDGGSFVWLADQSAGVVRHSPVKTGAANGSGLIEITAGLSVGSRILTSGIEGIQDGDRIRVTGEDNVN